MKTPKSVKIVAVIMLLAVAVSAGIYLLQRRSAACARDEADVNAIYQVVGEFGARLKDVPDSSRQSVALKVAASDVGVQIVKGVRVFHVEEGLDIPIFKTSDGKNETISINAYEAIYLKDAPVWAASRIRDEMNSSTVAALDSNLRQLITDRFYQAIKNDPSTVPGKPVSGSYPNSIQIDSVKKLSSTSYTVVGKVKLMTSTQTATGGVAGQSPIILTLMLNKVDGNWLIDAVTQSSLPMMP